MLAVDSAVTHSINHFAQVSHAFDSFVVAISHNGIFKAGPLLALIWYYWFRRDERLNDRRVSIVSLMGAALVAAAISVVLSRVLPPRLRPLIDPDMGFVIPFTMAPEGWERVSSLPSDHASMFMALAAGILALSRRWGVAAVVFALGFVLLPRLYLGLHYATDLLSGALIGLVCVALANAQSVRRTLSQKVVDFSESRPEWFYFLFFLLSYQIADVFQAGREVLGVLFKLLIGRL